MNPYKLLLAKYMAVILRDESEDHLSAPGDYIPGLTSADDNKELLAIRQQLRLAETSIDKYDWSKFDAKND